MYVTFIILYDNLFEIATVTEDKMYKPKLYWLPKLGQFSRLISYSTACRLSEFPFIVHLIKHSLKAHKKTNVWHAESGLAVPYVCFIHFIDALEAPMPHKALVSYFARTLTLMRFNTSSRMAFSVTLIISQRPPQENGVRRNSSRV